MKKPSSVDAIIAESLYPKILIKLRAIILETELKETIKWMFPVYTLKNKNVVGLGSFKDYAGIWFFQGVFLSDDAKVLVNAQEGKTKAMRQWRFNTIQNLDEDLVRAYVLEAIQNQIDGKEIKPERKKKESLVIPYLLQSALDKNSLLKERFEKLAPYKQREYAEHILTAKREATKINRLEKSIPMILAGKGLMDHYR